MFFRNKARTENSRIGNQQKGRIFLGTASPIIFGGKKMKKVTTFASIACLSLLLSIPAFANQDEANLSIQTQYSVNQTNNLNAKNDTTTVNQNSTANQNGKYRAQAVANENRGTNWSWLGLLGLLGLTGLRKRSPERSHERS